MLLTKLQYPIGQFVEQPFSEIQFQKWLLDIELLPKFLEQAILNLDQFQLDTPYRPEGWTVQQVVHHVADSHMNAFIRFKLGLTENNPIIKPYDENAWAALDDTKNSPVNISLTLLYALHNRWAELLKSIQSAQWDRTIFHPAKNTKVSLWSMLGMYAWHGKHHVAHITELRKRNAWY